MAVQFSDTKKKNRDRVGPLVVPPAVSVGQGWRNVSAGVGSIVGRIPCLDNSSAGGYLLDIRSGLTNFGRALDTGPATALKNELRARVNPSERALSLKPPSDIPGSRKGGAA